MENMASDRCASRGMASVDNTGPRTFKVSKETMNNEQHLRGGGSSDWAQVQLLLRIHVSRQLLGKELLSKVR